MKKTLIGLGMLALSLTLSGQAQARGYHNDRGSCRPERHERYERPSHSSWRGHARGGWQVAEARGSWRDQERYERRTPSCDSKPQISVRPRFDVVIRF